MKVSYISTAFGLAPSTKSLSDAQHAPQTIHNGRGRLLALVRARGVLLFFARRLEAHICGIVVHPPLAGVDPVLGIPFLEAQLQDVLKVCVPTRAPTLSKYAWKRRVHVFKGRKSARMLCMPPLLGHPS